MYKVYCSQQVVFQTNDLDIYEFMKDVFYHSNWSNYINVIRPIKI